MLFKQTASIGLKTVKLITLSILWYVYKVTIARNYNVFSGSNLHLISGVNIKIEIVYGYGTGKHNI